VENVIDASCEVTDQGRVADVTADDLNSAPLSSGREIAPASTNKVVQDDDFRCASIQQLVNNGAADETSTAGYQATCT
jgi:hypothetical protein